MSCIAGFGAYLPPTVITNQQLSAELNVPESWIVEVSGIHERRLADSTQSVVDLAVLAARDCLQNVSFDPKDIGLVLLSSGSGPRRFPGPAASLGNLLELSGVPCIDVPIASAGSLFALTLANSLAPVHGPVLVVAAEIMSTIAHRQPIDKNVAVLFGDGSGACLVLPGNKGLLAINHVAIHSDGAFSDELSLDFEGLLHMNGLSVIMQASRKIPAAIREVLSAGALQPEDVSAFLMHQANQNLIDRVAKSLSVPSQRFFSNIASFGNTSSASMLIAASEYFTAAHRIGGPSSGTHFCFAAFGAGYHWGAILTQAT